MDASPSGTPIPYDASFEHVDADEADTIAELQEALLKISHTTFADSGHGLRSVHAKCHGLLRGEMRVLGGLQPPWAQGIFERPRTYPVVMRLSTSPGDLLADSVSLPRGVAIKVLGVEGERLPGSEDATTQDFLMVDGPNFLAPDAKHFLNSVKLLAATTDKAEGLKKGLSAVLRVAERALESADVESGTLKGLGGHPMTHILGETFFTQAPLRHGQYMGKFSLVPVSPQLTALTGAPLDLVKRPDGLREAVRDYFRDHGAEWELRVQLCTDLETMPIEDASVPWPQMQSPYVAVARITAPRQVSWDGVRSMAMDDRLCFSPWHGVVAHQPLGSVMRARKQVYAASAQFRGQHNGCPMHQARTVDEALPP
jgi:hypothetical protein